MDETRSTFSLRWPPAWRPRQNVARREAAPAPLPWRARVRTRVIVCVACLALWTIAIEARLVYLQVLRHADLLEQAERQQLREVKLPGERGDVLDRNGKILAYSVDAVTVYADPLKIEDPVAAAAAICGVLPGCDAKHRDALAEGLARRKRQGARHYGLLRQVPPDQARPIKDLGLKGLVFLNESKRYYPNRELAAHVIGFVDVDSKGLAGIERAYDGRIRGREGKVLVQVDELRRAVETREQILPHAGESVELTIDEYLQHITEQELRAGVLENNAASGRAIVMQPSTGQILAQANYPTFNPNEPRAVEAWARRNASVEDVYEPGSTFKIVTASAALQEGIVTPDEPVDCSPGYIYFGSRRITDTHHYGVLPFADVIVKSSNVGAIKVGQKLGPERMNRYVARFGFGQKLAPDFQGQTPGIVFKTEHLNPSALASVSMGYQIAVTPLQMATAVSAVANGGELLQPRIVRAFIKDGQRQEIPRKVLGRAIEPATAAIMTSIMEQVVERGTAKAAKIPGYALAGKTGTAKQAIDGRYSSSEYHASFVGFAPSRSPAFAIIVVIDSPHGPNGYYGGAVAAPVFRRIAEKALRYAGIPPSLNALPPVLTARHTGPGFGSTPVSGPVREPVATQPGMVPDLRGLSAREALRVLVRAGMSVGHMEGDGFVVDQDPLPGSGFARGDTCTLRLDRRPAVPTGGAQQ